MLETLTETQVYWIYHSNDCTPKWKNSGEAKLINHYLTDIMQRCIPERIGIIAAFKDQKKIMKKTKEPSNIILIFNSIIRRIFLQKVTKTLPNLIILLI